MKVGFNLIPLMTFMLAIVSISAQSGIIKGQILDIQSKEPMIGAAILIDGTSSGSTTDFDGNFEIHNVPAGVHNLTITSIGYADLKLEKVRVESGKETIINK